VNLINGLCAKNGTDRGNTCKLHLSLQPRFIVRFNQLVSLTSQTWDPSKQNADPDEPEEIEREEEVHGEEDEEGTGQMVVNDEEAHEEADYDEYDETGEELQEEVDQGEQNHVKFQEHSEGHVEQEAEDGLTAAEEDELYEENDESYDPTLQSTEAVINDDDIVEEFDEPDDHTGYDDIQGEEEYREEALHTADLEQPNVFAQHGIYLDSWLRLTRSDSEDGNGNDDDDLISYEEAVDQTEEGQDYRQQYLNEETTKRDQVQNGKINVHQSTNDTEHVPQNGTYIAPAEGQTDTIEDDVNSHMSDTDILTSKRPLDEVVDPSIQDQEPRKRSRLR